MRNAATALSCCALSGLMLAAAGAVWSFGGWGMAQDHPEYSRDQASLAVIASRLRERLQQAYDDGALTDREVSVVFGGGAVRSVRHAPGRTEIVARIAVTGYARCYRFTAVPSGAVSSAVLSECPTASAAPARARIRHEARHALRADHA